MINISGDVLNEGIHVIIVINWVTVISINYHEVHLYFPNYFGMVSIKVLVGGEENMVNRVENEKRGNFFLIFYFGFIEIAKNFEVYRVVSVKIFVNNNRDLVENSVNNTNIDTESSVKNMVDSDSD